MQSRTIPSGTVTFLFTDIEGSTRLWENYPNEMNVALARHDQILRSAIETNAGYVFKTVGDAFCAAFETVSQALQAALAIQRQLLMEKWPTPVSLKVRIGLHTGEANERDNDYFGPALNRIARIFSAGHGGQTLLSAVTAQLLHNQLSIGIELKDLGWHNFKDLNQPEQVFQLITPDLPQEFPPIKSLETKSKTINDIPAGSGQRLIGREQEIAEINRLLRNKDVHLVTLTGIGGTGKTRLSLAIARTVRSEFPAGVYFVALEAVTHPETLIAELCATLQVSEVAGRSLLDTLKAYLQDKQMLIVLDNFEQLVETAPLLLEILKAAPKVKLLVTSRVNLRLSVEREYAVPTLTLPQRTNISDLAVEQLLNYTAVGLFVARAQAVRPEFTLTKENVIAVLEICRRLDGLPLAIELAAARIRAFTPQKLLERLSLKLLTGGAVDLPFRQQTLRGAIDWSYDLLSAEEQQLFRSLGVFAGGGTLEAIETVCENLALDIFNELESLVLKNLLRQKLDTNGEMRYSLLQTTQEYALEKLIAAGEIEAVNAKYTEYYLQWAEKQSPKLRGAYQIQIYQEFDSEYDNLRKVLSQILSKGATEIALRLSAALGQYWETRSYWSEGCNYLEQVLALSGNTPKYRATCLNQLGRLYHLQGNQTQATRFLQEGLSLSRSIEDMPNIAYGLNGLGNVAANKNEYLEAQKYFEESLLLYEGLGDKWGSAYSFNGLGKVLNMQGEHQKARQYAEKGLIFSQELGDKRGISFASNNLGIAAFEKGDHAKAQYYWRNSLHINQELGDKRSIVICSNNLGVAAYAQKDYRKAQQYWQDGLAIRRDIGDRIGITGSLNNLGVLNYEQGKYVEAEQYWQECLIVSQETNFKWTFVEASKGLGDIALLNKDYVKARYYYQQSLEISQEVGISKARVNVLISILNLATNLWLEGKFTDLSLTVQFLGVVQTWLGENGVTLEPVEKDFYEQAREITRQGLSEAIYAEAFSEGQTMPVEQAIEKAVSFLEQLV